MNYAKTGMTAVVPSIVTCIVNYTVASDWTSESAIISGNFEVYFKEAYSAVREELKSVALTSFSQNTGIIKPSPANLLRLVSLKMLTIILFLNRSTCFIL